MAGISVVINTLNEEENIKRVIASVKWADEILVCDMHSEDKTVQIAKSLGAKVVMHKKERYVEPARNFAISKAAGEWILILDADEVILLDLAERLQEIAEKLLHISFVEIPRRNIIFGKGLEATGWWPDYHIRFFKKGSVVWQDQIHSKPEIRGEGLKLEAEEKWSIIHQNYKTVGEFVEKMNRYTQIQAEEIKETGYKFKWQDILQKPLDEFLSRFFANEGYRDGLHGLSLSLLQAFSHLVLYLKLWEMEGFKNGEIGVLEFDLERKKAGEALKYWIKEKNSTGFSRVFKIFKK